jgi:hypothetical protein
MFFLKIYINELKRNILVTFYVRKIAILYEKITIGPISLSGEL